jgi:predicted nucleic acid-binding protein
VTKVVVLDTGPLSRACDPARNVELYHWLEGLLASGFVIVVPEIADYEARRGMLHRRMTRALRRLDQLKSTLEYSTLSTPIMMRAAELWAQARRRGRPTADVKELDGDVILAAQAEDAQSRLACDEIVIATENIGHLSQFISVKRWKEIA